MRWVRQDHRGHDTGARQRMSDPDFTCPDCGAKLERDGRVWVCHSCKVRHVFEESSWRCAYGHINPPTVKTCQRRHPSLTGILNGGSGPVIEGRKALDPFVQLEVESQS
jgi:hypothetical protein